MGKFCESTYEEAFIDLLEQNGWEYTCGDDLHRKLDETIIEDDLRDYFSRKYADSVLPLVAQKRPGVSVLVVKNSRNKLLHAVDVAQFNAQYANSLIVRVSDKFHDRFLVIDKTTLIHVGASLNCLGKKCFAFSSLDKSNIPDILAKI